MHKYDIRLYWSDEDEAFIAEVPELPGCMAHGPTPQAALALVHEAIDLWIDWTAEEEGDQRFLMEATQTAFDKVWDNPEDDVYSELIKE